MNEVKVATVPQPFASLIAAGAKTLLDQARPTGYRGRLLIRSAMTRPEVGMVLDPDGACPWEVQERDASQYVLYHWSGKDQRFVDVPLPLGVVVASCELVDCVPIIEWLATAYHHAPLPNVGVSLSGDFAMLNRERGIGGKSLVSDQRPFGDFAPGRWVWLLDDLRPTTERCPRCWAVADKPWYPTMAVCDTCHETGGCPPVRMRGGPGLRTPEWEA